MRLIIDGNALLNQALLRGTDHDEGRIVKDDAGKDVQVNSANYGIEGFFEKYARVLEEFSVTPINTIVVWDGMNAKLRRRSFLERYKAGRDKHPAVSEQLNLAREAVTTMLKHLGAHTAVQDGFEADDVIGYLCKVLRTTRNTVITGDGDLTVLVDENTDVYRLLPNGNELNKNPYGPIPFKFVTLYKAVVGDTSDKIPGARGFGDKAFVKFVGLYGIEGLQELEDMILQGRLQELRDNVKEMPELQRILDDIAGVQVSWRVASLMINQINTRTNPLRLTPGMVALWSELPEEMRVHRLRHFYGTKTLVTAENFVPAYTRFYTAVAKSPFVALDIETDNPEASKEWLDRVNAISEKGNSNKVDVLGHELCGMSITFGDNLQHTVYMTVNHRDSDNITVDQCETWCRAIPSDRMHTVIHNRNFEFSVLWRTWGDRWLDNGWLGFLPNAIDTKIGAAYVDENLPKGLKSLSKHYLGYEQTTYEQVTTLIGRFGDLPPGGESRGEHTDPDGEILEKRQYGMSELSAEHVFDYGCDDTICTAALHNHFRLVMEIEGTWDIYLDVETLPEYLTTRAFIEGFPIRLSKLREMEVRDDERYDEAWAVLRDCLMKLGWAGTTCPVFDQVDVSAVRTSLDLLVPSETPFSTRKKKFDAVMVDVRAFLDQNPGNDFLLHLFETQDVKALNDFVKSRFTGEPTINFGSPKQMQDLFYRHLGLKPRILNRMTEKQKNENVTMAEAFKKRRRAKDAGVDIFSVTEEVKVGRTVIRPLTAEEYDSLISKASTDDDVVETALVKDDLSEETVKVLKAFQTIKTIMTRRALFYKAYKVYPHWRDGRVHPSLNQSEAVTGRYSSSAPNVQQLPKRGEGVEFRQIVLPHHKDAVVVSLDWSGQELRLMAEWSQDENMLACYIGDNLKDIHSLVAVAAAPFILGETFSYDEFRARLESEDKVVAKAAKDHRGSSKTVNFATQYDAGAEKLSIQLMTDEETAQKFIDAKAAAFPRVEPWKDSVREQVERDGYATTMLGRRRHLSAALSSPNRAEANKAGRQGPNFKIQGSGAEMGKRALASMWKAGIFFTPRYDAQFYAPIHDEVVFSVHRDQAIDVIREVHGCMVQPYANMRVPIVSSISLGRSFGEQIECGEEFDEAVIRKALDKALETEEAAA